MGHRLTLLVLLLFCMAMPGMAQTGSADPEKIENIRHLLTMVGADKIRDAMMNQMIDGLTKNLPPIGQDEQARKMTTRLMELLREEMKKADFNSITVDLYDRYFTADEIKSLIQFYSSPVGQKATQVLPALTQEATSRGMELGQAAGTRAFTRWFNEFPEVKKSLGGK
jgi:uncharacterized protein